MKKILWITITVLFIDQLSKLYIKTHFELNQELKIFEWFRITFVENPGMAYGVQFGGFTGKIILSLLRLILIYYMFIYLKRGVRNMNSTLFVLPGGLIFAGAIGNLVDSIFYGVLFDSGTTFSSLTQSWVGYKGISSFSSVGYAPLFGGCVVDMLRFPLIDFVLPSWIPYFGAERFQFFNYIFNIADSSITVGAAIVLIALLVNPKAYKKNLFV